jgi:hypothetical protein
LATITFYGLDLSQASKVTVSIIHTEGGEAEEMRSWNSDTTDMRNDGATGQEIVQFIDDRDVKSVALKTERTSHLTLTGFRTGHNLADERNFIDWDRSTIPVGRELVFVEREWA